MVGGISAQKKTTVGVNVGVILEMDTWFGKMGWSCISVALSDFYSSHTHYRTRLSLHLRNSSNNVVSAAAAALDLIKNVEVEAIIGPQTSMQANFVINLGDEAQVPIVSFSATSPFLSSIQSSYFIRTTLNDSSQVKALKAIVKAFGWREVVPIYVDNVYGQGFMPFLTDALQEIDTRIPYRSVIHPLASDDEIVAELRKLMTMAGRVFVVHMFLSLGSRLFAKAKEVGMMTEGYAWIITDGVSNFLNSMDPSIIDSMQGVIGVTPHVPRTSRLENFTRRWKTESQKWNLTDCSLNNYGLWAYDTATALAMAVERVASTNSSFQKPNISGMSTDLEAYGVSQMGKHLSEVLSRARFRGLSGDFHIANGQLQYDAFEIINVIGVGKRRIGFWTPKNGLVRELLDENNIANNFPSRSNLKDIIWPGDTSNVPRGWVVPTKGKALRIGVPLKDGESDFVRMTKDPKTNSTTFSGYSIEVFDATMAMLPYSVHYEYVPFAKPDGKTRALMTTYCVKLPWGILMLPLEILQSQQTDPYA
ncbi:hypothetical protein NMG60_11031854 [Bertholletia excelsa]